MSDLIKQYTICSLFKVILPTNRHGLDVTIEGKLYCYNKMLECKDNGQKRLLQGVHIWLFESYLHYVIEEIY